MDFKLSGIWMCPKSVLQVGMDSQALCYKTGLLPSLFSVSSAAALFVAVYALAVVCVFSFLLADKVGGAFFDT